MKKILIGSAELRGRALKLETDLIIVSRRCGVSKSILAGRFDTHTAASLTAGWILDTRKSCHGKINRDCTRCRSGALREAQQG